MREREERRTAKQEIFLINKKKEKTATKNRNMYGWTRRKYHHNREAFNQNCPIKWTPMTRSTSLAGMLKTGYLCIYKLKFSIDSLKFTTIFFISFLC